MRWLFLAVFTTFLFASQFAVAEQPRVVFKTNVGAFEVEVFPDEAPVTSENFLAYVDASFFEDLIFHRVIENFMVQTGGYTADMELREPGDSIINESVGGPRNLRGTLSMARLRNPDSASAQFFINVTDNAHLDARGDRPGYAVFGRVVSGMDVVDAISQVDTTVVAGMSDVPVERIVITSVRRVNPGS
ncbi:MAG: peptidylprolyl isomerase A [Gammaproteobacteria bacterium]|nr:MAG: peptidylprolyl isomerase A [Gammaproteobacteria bacterium]